MFLDASAITAIIVQEADWKELTDKAEASDFPLTSALSIYEATLAVARLGDGSIETARDLVTEFLDRGRCKIIAIDSDIGTEAIAAFARFGKGRHRASLNLGDCFAYACAKVHRVPLLCKGDNFRHTDIQIA